MDEVQLDVDGDAEGPVGERPLSDEMTMEQLNAIREKLLLELMAKKNDSTARKHAPRKRKRKGSRRFNTVNRELSQLTNHCPSTFVSTSCREPADKLQSNNAKRSINSQPCDADNTCVSNSTATKKAMDIDSSGVEHPTADVIPTCSPMIDSDDGDEESMSDDDPIDVDDLLEESYRMRDERDSLAAPSAAVNGCPSSGSADAPAELSHKYKDKLVLKYKNAEHFEVLPNGWVEILHKCGLPIYLHKGSRVCTFGRPYFIGRGSVKAHHVPIVAIPCLYQKRMKQLADQASPPEEQQPKCTGIEAASQSTNGEFASPLPARVPGAIVQTSLHYKKRNLTPRQLFEYAKSGFEFETIKVLRLNKWVNVREYHRQKKAIKRKEIEDRDDARLKQLDGLANSLSSANGASSVAVAETSPAAAANSAPSTSLLRPTFPDHVKLITIPATTERGEGGVAFIRNGSKRHFFINPNGKTSVALLHDYVQKALKAHIAYEFTETRNASQPYSATVKIKINPGNSLNSALLCDSLQRRDSTALESNSSNSLASSSNTNAPSALAKSRLDLMPTDNMVTLGTGYGNSKKIAKAEAAKKALEVLVPGLEVKGLSKTQSGAGANFGAAEMGDEQVDETLALFDMFGVTDTRVPEMSAKTGQPMPYAVLQEFLRRNAPFGDTSVVESIRRKRHQLHLYSMNVGNGKYISNVFCTNKREGKQKASQALLLKMNPHIDTWGSMLRLYGSPSNRDRVNAKQHKDDVIKLQTGINGGNNATEPNRAVLEKLGLEMGRLYSSRQSTASSRSFKEDFGSTSDAGVQRPINFSTPSFGCLLAGVQADAPLLTTK